MARLRWVVAVVALALMGCASLPSKEEPFCYARLKLDRQKKGGSVGVRCYW